MDNYREIARGTFDSVASLYDEARPGYPQAVFDHMVSIAALAPNARLLEIGCGTGHATLPLAQRSYRIDCVELGKQMAAVARKRLSAFPAVTVTVANFDDWASEERYDLAFAASSYHWLNPVTRVNRIADILVPGGHIAILRNHHIRTDQTARFNAAVQDVYKRALGSKYRFKELPHASEILPEEAGEWSRSGHFSSAVTRTLFWQQKLTAGEFVRQLATHSDHRMLPEQDRNQLFEMLRSLIDREFAGVAQKSYITLLQIAEKIL